MNFAQVVVFLVQTHLEGFQQAAAILGAFATMAVFVKLLVSAISGERGNWL